MLKVRLLWSPDLKGQSRMIKRGLVDRKMMDMGRKKLIWMHTKMLEIRLFEKRIADLYRRGHMHNIARGVPSSKLAAEVLGEAAGLCEGRGLDSNVST